MGEPLYPVTIIRTRYGGIYEGGKWAAFELDPEDVPADATSGDIVCAPWWVDHGHAVGVGADPAAALADLETKNAAGHRLPRPR